MDDAEFIEMWSRFLYRLSGYEEMWAYENMPEWLAREYKYWQFED